MKNWKRNIIALFTGQGVTLFGAMIVHYAVQWHIMLETQSGVAITLLSISMAIPMLFASPLAGVWADRYNKKLIINFADAGVAALTLVMAVIFSLGYTRIALLLVCIALRGFGKGLQPSAMMSLIPEIVPEEHLMRVNGFSSSMSSAIAFISPMAGGALIAFAPLQVAFYIDVITTLIGISLIGFFVKVPARKKAAAQKSATNEMKEGLRYIKKNAFVKKMMIGAALARLLLNPALVLAPLHAVRNFGEEPWRLAAVQIAMMAGMTLGGLVIGAWGGFKNKIYTVTLGCVLTGLAVFGLGLFDNFTLFLICMGGVGFFIQMLDTPIMTMFQTKVEGEFMGRVFAAFGVISGVITPISMAIWGPLADVVNISWLMFAGGVGILGLSAYIIMSRTLREAGASDAIASPTQEAVPE
ncbi:MAG: MFS transporter [Oscillospiraceae bacterium]|nr:MFS transporter [Oscillospiraceae bacterium]